MTGKDIEMMDRRIDVAERLRKLMQVSCMFAMINYFLADLDDDQRLDMYYNLADYFDWSISDIDYFQKCIVYDVKH